MPGDHRIQPVARQNGVLWINDSKATNPHAAAASLAAFSNVVWIAGGLSKGVSYDHLVREHAHAAQGRGADWNRHLGARWRPSSDTRRMSP